MPILLRTQVERTAKTPVTARRARVGGLCRFRRPAERVPAGSPKTGRCADVRENRKFDQNPAQRVRSKEEMRRNGRDLPLAANAGTRRNGQNRGVLGAAARKRRESGEKAARKQPAMDLSRDKNAEEMKWSPLEMGAAMQAHGA